jgi:hypothetical protein
VWHRTVRCTKRSNDYSRNGRLHSALTELHFTAEVRAGVRGAPDSEQYLSGAALDCPVHQAIRAPMVKTVRTLTVGWHGWHTGQCPVAHRTVRCAHRQQPNPNGWFGGWGYKYPQPPPFIASKFSSNYIQYKSSRLHSKTQTRDQILSKVQNHSKYLVTCEKEIFVFLWVLVAWIAFLLPILVLKTLVIKARDTNCVVVLAGSKWIIWLRRKAHSV